MPRYRKRPVEVDAVQYEDESRQREFIDSMPYGLWGPCGGRGELIGMVTIHGATAYAAPGDWVVAEPEAGRFYPIKADIFAETYEQVDS